MNYILEQLDEFDKVIKFNETEVQNYDIDIDIIKEWGIGGTELLIYSFLFANAFEYWDEKIDPSAPAGEVYIEMDLHDFVKVTGCNVQEIRGALQVLNEDRWVRVVELNREYGKAYAYHATT